MTDLREVDYNPSHFVERTSTMRTIEDPAAVGYDAYINVDAIYHYFESNTAGDPDTDGGEDRKMGHADAIALLIAGRFEAEMRAVNSASPEVEPNWQQYRRTTSFIAGALTEGYMNILKQTLPNVMSDNTIFLDGSAYADEHGVGEELDAFNKLMNLAGNTKSVIENALAIEYCHDARGAIKFLNSSPTDEIDPPAGQAHVGHYPTKWMVEARYLANELVKIMEFRKNFNTLVIYNAHRYIASDQLNLTKLYRLMAKLGRVNTRIVFVG